MITVDPVFVERLVQIGKYLPEWLQAVFSTTAPIWGVITLQAFYGKAQNINSREETREEIRLAEREKESNLKKVKLYSAEIEALLWQGLDFIHDRALTSGDKMIKIHHGNDILSKSISDFRRDYHHGFGKMTPVFIEEVSEQIQDEVDRTGSIGLDEIARCARLKYLDGTHKRAGYNSDVVDMEEKFLPYSVVREMIEKIYISAVRNRAKRIDDEKKLAEHYSINLLSVVKVARVLFRRGKK